MQAQLQHINHHLREVGKQHDIPAFQLDADGSTGLRLKNGVTVYFEYVDDVRRLFIYSPVIDIPLELPQRLALFDTVLEMNFLEANGRTGRLAIFSTTRQVIYQIGLDTVALDAQRINHALLDFLSQHENVRRMAQHSRTPSTQVSTNSLNGASTASRLATWRRM